MKNKYQMCACEYTATSQNGIPIGMSPSGVIFNLTSSLTNEWTPPFRFFLDLTVFFTHGNNSTLQNYIQFINLHKINLFLSFFFFILLQGDVNYRKYFGANNLKYFLVI